MSPRDDYIAAEVAGGRTMTEVAAEVGLSITRVAQICGKRGVLSNKTKEERRRREAAEKERWNR